MKTPKLSLKKICLLILFLNNLVYSQGLTENSTAKSHYDIKASLNPETENISASVTIFIAMDVSTDTLRFLIHEDLLPLSITAPKKPSAGIAYEARPFMEHLKEIVIATENIQSSPQGFYLNWSYEGRLHNDKLTMGHAAISPAWTELPLEAMWVPSLFPFKSYTFSAEIDLPENYELVSPGNFQFTDGSWRIQNSRQALDVVIIASDQMKTKSLNIGHKKMLHVKYVDAQEATVEFIVKEFDEIFKSYRHLLPMEHIGPEIFVTISPLKNIIAQNYSRNNLIAIGKDYGPGRDLFHLLAHEAAHFWWSNAADINTADNFLNESFAQFFAMYMVGNKYGDEELKVMLDKTRESVKELPPLKELKESDMRRFTYGKGPVLIFDLREKMGDLKFKQFLQVLLEKRVQTVDHMLAELKNITRDPVYEWFVSQL